jgi:hypothetical protein
MFLYQDHSSYRQVVHRSIHICGNGCGTPGRDIHQLVTESGPDARGRLRKSITLPRSRQASIGPRSKTRKNAEFDGVEELPVFFPQEKARWDKLFPVSATSHFG